MDVMNTISALSLSMIKLFCTPNFKIFKKIKINKEINKYCDIIRNEDIFKVSEEMYNFLKSIPKILLDNCEIKVFSLNMQMKIDNSLVVYHATKNNVEVYSEKSNMCYIIYKSSRIPSPILKDWIALDHNVRNFYIEIISNISYELAFGLPK